MSPEHEPKIAYGTSTHNGPMHEHNQDACHAQVAMQWKPGTTTEEEFGFFIVADGMGGLAEGEKASRLAVDELVETVQEGLQHETQFPDLLKQGVQVANQAVQENVSGAGCTLSTVALWGNIAYIAHVGDTRVYVLDDDTIEQLTRDHSLVQRLIEVGQLTPVEAKEHPQKNVLYRALGQEDQMEVDTFSHLLFAGSTLLLCTDGLWNDVDDAAMLEIVRQAENPQAAADELVRRSVEAGAQDDVTAIVVTRG